MSACSCIVNHRMSYNIPDELCLWLLIILCSYRQRWNHHWAWTQFYKTIPLSEEIQAKLKRGEHVRLDLTSKALNSDFNVQPERMEPYWNSRGIAINRKYSFSSFCWFGFPLSVVLTQSPCYSLPHHHTLLIIDWYHVNVSTAGSVFHCRLSCPYFVVVLTQPPCYSLPQNHHSQQ